MAQFENEWYLRALVLSSLSLQVILYVVAPRRKRIKSLPFFSFISMVFSLSNWVPTLGLVLIYSCAVSDNACYESPLLAWASCLLLHRGTSHSSLQTEFNKVLWQTLLEFLFHDVLFGCILFLRWKERLFLAFPIMFLACQKTCLKLKRLRNRQEEMKALSGLEVPAAATTVWQDSKITVEPIHLARHLFKGSLQCQHNRSSSLFQIPYTKAINIVEDELNLLYDKFYGEVHFSKGFELILLVYQLVLTLWGVAYDVKPFQAVKHVLLKIDPDTKMMLLMSFPLLIPIAFLMVLAIKPQTASLPPREKSIISGEDEGEEEGASTLAKLGKTTELLTCRNASPSDINVAGQATPPSVKWCQTIPRFNLLVYALRKPMKLSVAANYLLNIKSLSSRPREQYTDGVGIFIFNELKSLTGIVPTTTSSHGKGRSDSGNMVDEGVSFGESVLKWHLATGICYHSSGTTIDSGHHSPSLSLLLSDYMGYLLIVQPWIMSKGRPNVLQHSLEVWSDIKELIIRSGITDDQLQKMQVGKFRQHVRHLENSRQEDLPKSLLRDGFILANELELLFPDANQRWDAIAKVWVLMLAYAAIHSDPLNHIKGLCQGGELASVVWLWMGHLGLMGNFYEIWNRLNLSDNPSFLVDLKPGAKLL